MKKEQTNWIMIESKHLLEFVAGFYLLCLARDQNIDDLELELELLSVSQQIRDFK